MKYTIQKSLLDRKLIPRLIAAVVLSAVCSGHIRADSKLEANELKLRLKPEQCIAMRQGKDCYTDIEINWIATQAGHYCLFSSQQTHALQCWDSSSKGTFTEEIVSKTDVQLHLKRSDKDGVIVSRKLKVVWVYKKKSRSRLSWRMF